MALFVSCVLGLSDSLTHSVFSICSALLRLVLLFSMLFHFAS